MMRMIFRGEETRRRARIEKEANMIHRETLDHIDETGEVMQEDNPELIAFEEMLRKEDDEILALLMAREEADISLEMDDVLMSDISIDEE